MSIYQYSKEAFAWLEARAYNKYSQFGEDGIVEAIFERIGPANKWVMECGAADGVFFSNSRKLIEEGWKGLLVESNVDQYKKLAELYYDQRDTGQGRSKWVAKTDVRCYRRQAVAILQNFTTNAPVATLEQMLSEQAAPLDLDLAVIDVDGQDYWLFNSLLRYKPRVVMVEYNPVMPIDFVPEIGATEGQAGLQAIIRLGVGKEYYPVCATRCNVIFVQRELVHLVAEVNPDAFAPPVYKSRGTVREYAEEAARSNPEIARILAKRKSKSGTDSLADDAPAFSTKEVANDNAPLLVASEKKTCDSCNYDFISVGGRTNCNQCEEKDAGELDNQPPIIDPLADDAYAQSVKKTWANGRLKPTVQYARTDANLLEKAIYNDGSPGTANKLKCPHGGYIGNPWGENNCQCCGQHREYLESGLCVICNPKPTSLPYLAAPRIVAVTSIPQLGHNVNFGCQFEALSAFGIPIRQCYGAFWHQAISEGIAGVIEQGVDYILTLDYDTLFTAQDVADLVMLALENPDVDVIVPCLTKREGNGLCAHTKNQDPDAPGVNLNDSLIPIQLGHLGLTLFKASLFDRLEKPWMLPTASERGDWGEGHVDADMNFWLNCEKVGAKVMLARHVRIGHVEYMATIPNADDPRNIDYVHVGEWRKWAVAQNKVVIERIQNARNAYA